MSAQLQLFRRADEKELCWSCAGLGEENDGGEVGTSGFFNPPSSALVALGGGWGRDNFGLPGTLSDLPDKAAITEAIEELSVLSRI